MATTTAPSGFLTRFLTRDGLDAFLGLDLCQSLPASRCCLDEPGRSAVGSIRAGARLFSVPIAIVSVVDHDRIWFKSHHGVDVGQVDREPGLCASAILQNEPWIIRDARADSRALSNPLVAGELGLQFYAGIPLRPRDGYNLGTLCIIDRQPRTLSDQDVRTLEDLAAIVMNDPEQRLLSRRSA